MTLYNSFHLAMTNKGLSVCAHPAPVMKAGAAEIYGPFSDEKQAGEFVDAIVEGQIRLFAKIGKIYTAESSVRPVG